MWRESDSWFEIQFSDNSQGFVHLDENGSCIGVYRADGTSVGDVNVEYTCVNDNAQAPNWFVA